MRARAILGTRRAAHDVKGGHGGAPPLGTSTLDPESASRIYAAHTFPHLSTLSSTIMRSSCILAPTLFLSHGAGPAFFMDGQGSMFSDIDEHSVPAKAFREVGKNPEAHGLPASPDAIVIVSAHWEEGDAIHVMGTEKPKLLFDYSGFPRETYSLSYPAPGNPALAKEIVQMINTEFEKKAETPVRATLDLSSRGWDHGVFLPLLLLYPKANIPVVQISLHESLDPNLHVSLGQALSPLRAKNILIVGSGQATHPMSTRKGGSQIGSFMKWLESVLLSGSSESRADRLIGGLKDDSIRPLIRYAHNPRIEHFMPLFTVVGASSGTTGKELFSHAGGKDWRFVDGSFSLATYIFGS